MSSTNWDSHHPARWVVLLEAAALVLISQLILKYVLGRGEGSVYSAVGALVVVAGIAYWQKRRDGDAEIQHADPIHLRPGDRAGLWHVERYESDFDINGRQHLVVTYVSSTEESK